MNTKAFLVLLVAVLVLGGGIGGAFAGGMALGKSQGEEDSQSTLPAPSTPTSGQQFSDQSNQDQLSQLRQRFQSGQLSEQDRAQLLQQFQGQFGQDFGGRGGLTGTIEKIEGSTMTVNTPQGQLQATIAEETTIQRFAEGTLADLLTGVRVTVIGQRGEDGTVEARSILIIPVGEDGFFGGGFFSGDRPQPGQRQRP